MLERYVWCWNSLSQRMVEGTAGKKFHTSGTVASFSVSVLRLAFDFGFIRNHKKKRKRTHSLLFVQRFASCNVWIYFDQLFLFWNCPSLPQERPLSFSMRSILPD